MRTKDSPLVHQPKTGKVTHIKCIYVQMEIPFPLPDPIEGRSRVERIVGLYDEERHNRAVMAANVATLRQEVQFRKLF